MNNTKPDQKQKSSGLPPPPETPEPKTPSPQFQSLAVSFLTLFPPVRQYGGGRTIRPGEPLETAEEKAGREAKTRQLLDKYRRVAGLDMDAGTKSRCQQVSGRRAGAVQNLEFGRSRIGLGEAHVEMLGEAFFRVFYAALPGRMQREIPSRIAFRVWGLGFWVLFKARQCG